MTKIHMETQQHDHPLFLRPLYERIFRTAKKQVIIVMVVEVFLRPSILYTLLFFPLTSPFRFAWLVRGYFLYYFDDYLSVDELQPWLHSLDALRAFLLPLALIRFWYCLRTVFCLLLSYGLVRASCIIFAGILILQILPMGLIWRLFGFVLLGTMQACRAANRLLFDINDQLARHSIEFTTPSWRKKFCNISMHCLIGGDLEAPHLFFMKMIAL
jgi:hypothetical protein